MDTDNYSRPPLLLINKHLWEWRHYIKITVYYQLLNRNSNDKDSELPLTVEVDGKLGTSATSRVFPKSERPKYTDYNYKLFFGYNI